LEGKEGSVYLDWGSGFGGMCDPNKETLKLYNNTVLTCLHNLNNDGTENWSFSIGKEANEISYSNNAVANKPSSLNRAVILKILSTLKFTDQTLPTKTYPTPTLGPSYQEKIIWIPDNRGSYKDLRYSMEIPFPGPYCSGCYDSTGGMTDIMLSQVEGGFFKDSQPPNLAKNKWLIVQGIFTQGKYLAGVGESWGIPAGDFYKMLSNEKIGNKFLLYDNNKKSYSSVRLPDKIIDGVQFFIFNSDFNVSGFEPGNRTFAIFQKNGYVAYMSFEYNDTLYKDVFDHMLNTLSFSEIKGKTYEEVKNAYLNGTE